MKAGEGLIQMNRLEKINDDIYALCIPYLDIYTTVYFIRTESGMLLFDTAGSARDAEEDIIPVLRDTLGVGENDLRYIFVSHNHSDHAGGLARLLEEYPEACIVSGNEALREIYGSSGFLSPSDDEKLLECLSVVLVPGHTKDSASIYDSRTKTLISGDCLQLYGIFGSGKWGANVTFYKEHAEAVQKLRKMDIEAIFAAHDYHPCGRKYIGKEEIEKALDACLAPFEDIRRLIMENPDAYDEKICELYNSRKLPCLSVRVVKRYRETVLGNI